MKTKADGYQRWDKMSELTQLKRAIPNNRYWAAEQNNDIMRVLMAENKWIAVWKVKQSWVGLIFCPTWLSIGQRTRISLDLLQTVQDHNKQQAEYLPIALHSTVILSASLLCCLVHSYARSKCWIHC